MAWLQILADRRKSYLRQRCTAEEDPFRIRLYLCRGPSFAHVVTKACRAHALSDFRQRWVFEYLGRSVLAAGCLRYERLAGIALRLWIHIFERSAALFRCAAAGMTSATFPAYADTLGRWTPDRKACFAYGSGTRAETRCCRRTVLWQGPAGDPHARWRQGILAVQWVRVLFYRLCARRDLFDAADAGPMARAGWDIGEGCSSAALRRTRTRSSWTSSTSGRGALELTFKAVFIAGGPINTAAICCFARPNLYDRPIRLKESQKFVLPVLRRARRPHCGGTSFDHARLSLSRGAIRNFPIIGFTRK